MKSRTLRVTLIGLALLGLGVASYLTYAHYTGAEVPCPRGGGCETVQHSAYSTLAGVPVALIGLLGYIAILTSLLVPETETTRLATMAFTVIGFGFSAYLTSRELFSIHAICWWCVSSAVIMTLLLGLSVWRFLRGGEMPASAPAAASSIQPEAAAALGAVHS
jgi:uncharacterized membrane protein